MKKCLPLVALFALLAQKAAAVEVQPYVGADYVYSWASVKNKQYFNDRYQALNLSLGMMTTSTIGLEFSYQISEQNKKSSNFGQTKTEYKAYAVDGVYYLSLMDQLQGIASMGAGYYKVISKVKSDGDFYHENNNRFGLRVGLGAQYSLNENVALRLMGRYHYLDAKMIRHMADMTLGVRYYF